MKSAIKFCGECGKALPEGAGFCGECGTPVVQPVGLDKTSPDYSQVVPPSAEKKQESAAHQPQSLEFKFQNALCSAFTDCCLIVNYFVFSMYFLDMNDY